MNIICADRYQPTLLTNHTTTTYISLRYHLPLRSHPEYSNNAQLAQKFCILNQFKISKRRTLIPENNHVKYIRLFCYAIVPFSPIEVLLLENLERHVCCEMVSV